MLELIESDVVRTARAKGLDEWAVLIQHTFRLVLIPIISIIGMQFGSLLSGAVITETIFSWNGLGMLLVESIQTRDYPITQACIFIIAISYILINMIIPGPTNTNIWGKDMPHLQKPEDTFPTAKLLASMERGGPTGKVYWDEKEYPMFNKENEILN